jgi:hypothetical protein
METQQNNESNTSVLRSTAIGATLFAVVTAPGTCFYLVKWITTGNSLHLGEATALFVVASFMGGSGGAAYRMVIHSGIKNSWKPFVAVLAAVEAYLLTSSLSVFVIGLLAPKLNEGIPWDNVGFYLVLHGCGLLLCIMALGATHAPHIAKIVLGSAALVIAILFAVLMLILLGIKPENLDRWVVFLKPLNILGQLLLVSFVVVSIVGWIRYMRRPNRMLLMKEGEVE